MRHFKMKLIIALVIVAVGVSAFIIRSQPGFLQQPFSLSESSPSPAPNSLRFILIGDTGTGGEAQKLVGQSIADHCAQEQNCQAVFIAGDVFYEEGVKSVNDPQFQTKFEQPYQPVNLPFYIAFGNHDYLGCETCYLEYARTAQKWRMPARYYAQQFEDAVTFYVVDTEVFDSQQQAWLKNELQELETPVNVVVGHRPIKTFEKTKVDEVWNGMHDLGELICQNADLYVSGHAHILEDGGQIDNCVTDQLVSGGGGAYPREVTEDNYDLFAHEGNGFVSLLVEGTKLTATFFNENGEKLHERVKVIDK